MEVQIGKFKLTLSPLEPEQVGPACEMGNRFVGAQLTRFSKEWFAAYQDCLGFIFLSARKNHPDLSFADLCDEATEEEVLVAFEKLMRDPLIRQTRD